MKHLHLSRIGLFLGAFILATFVATACIVTPSPDVRGWKCEKDEDCLGLLDCHQGFCRGSCPSGEDADCASLLKETCNADRYCLPPGPTCKKGDTRPCYTLSGTAGKGICKKGTQTCNDQNKWDTACKGQIGPIKESKNPCNGADDDCDGKVDNGIDCQCTPGSKRACYGNGVTVGCTNSSGTYTCKGICKAGTQICSQTSQWGSCKGWIGPAKNEECNGVDDDCDGKTDENPIKVGTTCTVPNQQGPCKAGKLSCENGKPVCRSTYNKTTEDCNGKDDDCDGSIDNLPGQTSPLRRPCNTGNSGCTSDGRGGYNCKGICVSGFQLCLVNQQSWSKTCDGQTLPKSQEVCNNADDDCNGKTDDSTVEEGKTCEISANKGICKAGTQVCTSGKVVCKQKNQSTTEVCNKKDDDCDGQTDEGSSICSNGKTCTNGTCQ